LKDRKTNAPGLTRVQEQRPTLVADAQPQLVYDYYGFEKEAYSLKYAAPGAPALASSIKQQLQCDP
jgi:aromatic ring-opening dioxygenase catalytic subunit (LigB family)